MNKKLILLSFVLILVISMSKVVDAALCPICDMPPAYEVCSGDYYSATSYQPCNACGGVYSVIFY